MLKKIHFNKIILVLFLVGIIIIGGMGAFFLVSLNNLDMQSQLGQVLNIQQLKERTITILVISGILFTIVGILVAIFLSQFIIYPINKLIESAEKITEDDKNSKKSPKGKKIKEAPDLENVLGLMTTELKEKLSEVSTQKNQIETILLHMTDRNNCI